jgi:hypothetical protein
MGFGQRLPDEDRREPRQPVLHRARAVQANGAELPVVIVNVSPRGFMARSDAPHEPGDLLAVHMPVIGALEAEVRWSLGGRIGCRLLRPIDPADYVLMLQIMMRGMTGASA